MKIANIPEIEWVNLKGIKDKRKSVLITSKSADKFSEQFLPGINAIEKIYIDTEDKRTIEDIAKRKISSKVIYAFGGGKVADIARFLAYKWQTEIICIPTIISTDAFLVDCTGLRENNCVRYFESKKADKVLLDISLLKKSPQRYNICGCGDVISIFSGLYDWKYANEMGVAKSDEIFSSSVSAIANGILKGLIADAQEIKKCSKKGLESIIMSLAMEVQLCYLYGNSRPEEGGEHFFTYCIENKVPSFLHGEMVAFGTLITSYLQGQDWLSIKTFMDKVGLNYKPNFLTRKIIIKTLAELPQYVKIHNLPYSIYNDFNYKKNSKKIEKFFKLLNIK